MSNDLNILF